ncbi:Putative flippase, transmembrane translocase of bactoprenol-linked glucose [Erythrobacter litoralis]|uniref:Polysaccharide biosynthesis protein GtrA n=1 Tax=Erythrobacter litoralis TaxID=39960 RepID=A0A074NFS3_9SPHN|nr:GtrA family protein [Erythrobacter litoralis]AOL24959.1 Putative flippase, transmembrane translocase of bactoprenol-linked glucose [Erythrobacter litoralis]KEO96482.1 polysaccharide biosynthesis protein GtrA [Erythrobacter litoralis]
MELATSLLARLRDVRFVRYLVASVGALAVDMGAFLALLAGGMAAAPASAIGYTLGILAHWLMSSRAVFHGNVAQGGLARTRQKALFVISALLGLALTTAIVGLGDSAGIDPRAAKLVAIAVSFMATWLVRSRIVFCAPATGRGEA